MQQFTLVVLEIQFSGACVSKVMVGERWGTCVLLSISVSFRSDVFSKCSFNIFEQNISQSFLCSSELRGKVLDFRFMEVSTDVRLDKYSRSVAAIVCPQSQR